MGTPQEEIRIKIQRIKNYLWEANRAVEEIEEQMKRLTPSTQLELIPEPPVAHKNSWAAIIDKTKTIWRA